MVVCEKDVGDVDLQCELPMPMIMTGNVRSLRNKTDISALCRYDFSYRESSMICLTETWLQDSDPDSSVDVDGFTMLRCDRNLESKTSGGGV